MERCYFWSLVWDGGMRMGWVDCIGGARVQRDNCKAEHPDATGGAILRLRVKYK